jgi:salicylate hydroxylase
LLQVCVEAPGITLETSKRVERVELVGDEVLVKCADGSTYRPGAVVGADGLWSTVRQFVVGDGPPTCRQHVAYRGTIPIESVAKTAGVDKVVWWIGPRIHLIQYPIRRGELYNQVAVFESDQYVPDSDHWGLVDELEDRFRSVAGPVAEGVAKINRDRRWALFDRDPVENWTSGRITLLGDAAHPMLQYLAQGAAQALEDAVALGSALEICDSYEEAFSRYQAQRLPRTSSLQIWARRMGEIVHSDGVGAILRDELLRPRAEDDFRYFEWLYGYGQDEHASA